MGKDLTTVRGMSLSNSKQECLKGNQSYFLFGLTEQEHSPHALLAQHLWLHIYMLCTLLLSWGY